MTIDKAIQILSDEPETLDWENEPQAIEALKLGIEALKRVKYVRETYQKSSYVLLPGETED